MDFLKKRIARNILCVLMGFCVSSVAGYTLGGFIKSDVTKNAAHHCKMDSMELSFKGAFSYSESIRNGLISSVSGLMKPSSGFANTPEKAVKIAIAGITQDDRIPCAIGLKMFDLYLCDRFWVLRGKANVDGSVAILEVQIDKETGRIWRIDRCGKNE